MTHKEKMLAVMRGEMVDTIPFVPRTVEIRLVKLPIGSIMHASYFARAWGLLIVFEA